MAEHQWKRRAYFAEVAETLGITTMQIVGLVEDKRTRGDAMIVVYTTTRDGEDVESVALTRNGDGILVPTSLPIPMPGFLAGLRERLDQDFPKEQP
jgi:hypothetical protein